MHRGPDVRTQTSGLRPGEYNPSEVLSGRGYLVLSASQRLIDCSEPRWKPYAERYPDADPTGEKALQCLRNFVATMSAWQYAETIEFGIDERAEMAGRVALAA